MDETRRDRAADTRHVDDNAPPRKRKRRRSSTHSPVEFSDMLAEAALQDGKLAPLLTKDKRMIRLRALQHMIVCNLRRRLAMEVKVICDGRSAPPDRMERVRKLMKHYGLPATLSRYIIVSYYCHKSTER